jgi:hypothetical protein
VQLGSERLRVTISRAAKTVTGAGTACSCDGCLMIGAMPADAKGLPAGMVAARMGDG